LDGGVIAGNLTAACGLQKKEVVRKTYEDRGRSAVVDEGPLDDPVAEKLRQQR
jgi:hypothetical protein